MTSKLRHIRTSSGWLASDSTPAPSGANTRFQRSITRSREHESHFGSAKAR
jgi:hypothetical protein